jgi:hypothetical protein
VSARDTLLAYAGTPSQLPEDMANAKLDAYRAEVLAEAAAELVAFCPDHGNRDTSFISCQCLAAEDLLSKAGTR